MIKSCSLDYPANRNEIFSKFHDTIYDEYQQALSGDNHLILKMYHFWEYFSTSFSNPHKTLKKIKKAKSLKKYDSAVKEILE